MGPDGLSVGGVPEGSGVGVTFGVQVRGNGNGDSVQLGVGEPMVQVGHGRSIVGGWAVVDRKSVV